jgi:xylan 1,4-beta-xylosidase
MPAIFNCDVNGENVGSATFWEHTVGSDHAPMALRADWRGQMRRCHDQFGFLHVRFHGLLSDVVRSLISEGDTLALRLEWENPLWKFGAEGCSARGV